MIAACTLVFLLTFWLPEPAGDRVFHACLVAVRAEAKLFTYALDDPAPPMDARRDEAPLLSE